MLDPDTTQQSTQLLIWKKCTDQSFFFAVDVFSFASCDFGSDRANWIDPHPAVGGG